METDCEVDLLKKFLVVVSALGDISLRCMFPCLFCTAHDRMSPVKKKESMCRNIVKMNFTGEKH